MVRVKYRYLVCFVSIHTSGSRLPPGYPGCHMNDAAALRLSEGNLLCTIRASVLAAHGCLGMGRCMARLRIIHWCPASGLLVLRCLRSEVTEIQAALSLVSQIEANGQNRRALIDVHHLSGTVRGCQKFLVSFYSHQLFSTPGKDVQTALSHLVQQKPTAKYPPQLIDKM
ncbi:hypothetical protein P879_10628 [Paragonimus westermani]|uniref:Ribonuclease P/MRP protein subunit POP5 n=1 Tax=Paragonimus westermani TaxID=34504 RepID=A0A8T0DFK8_9TREM|nr:hypothetical protein P879_10628 [Paragonimus westermani]